MSNAGHEDERSFQWAIFFRTKLGDAAFPRPMKRARWRKQTLCLTILDVPDYSQEEFDRCMTYLFRFFPDYEYRHSYRRDSHLEENWNLETLWGNYA